MPLDIHIIRLRGPWQLEAICRYARQLDRRYARLTDALPAPVKSTMPADWGKSFGADFLGQVRYRRVFHEPTGLEPHERVFLVVEPARSHAAVTLDDRPLGEIAFGSPPRRFDITSWLAETMKLEVVVSHPRLDERGLTADDSSVSQPGGLVGEVRLEIEE